MKNLISGGLVLLAIQFMAQLSNASAGMQCDLTYAEYFNQTHESKTVWVRPLAWDDEKKHYHISLESTPLPNVPTIDIQVFPYFNATATRRYVGLNVSANGINVEGNLRPMHPDFQSSSPGSACHFQMGWKSFPREENGVWSQWLTLNCFAPIEFCQYP